MGSGAEAAARRFQVLSPFLDERQRRLFLAAEARELGRGGIQALAELTGAGRSTINAGLRELEGGVALPAGRTRRPGAGRRKTTDRDPGLLGALDKLIDPESRGDPESPLRWTIKSTRQLAEALTVGGHPVSSWTVGELLHGLRYSLQANAKVLEGTQHPDRDAQFRYINRLAAHHLGHGQPVISVDTKKKELVGSYRNAGQTWRPEASPEEVNTYDFIDPAQGKAIPYGIYDLARNRGWVSVGTDHDTAAFAVASLRSWWSGDGMASYPGAHRLLISADGGGSNGYRTRLWKLELVRLAAQTGLWITVCHFPPGTSKWNKIEHRLFAMITSNWRGQPLTSHEVVVNLIGATTSRTGLSVHAEMDSRPYPKGIKVPDRTMAAIRPLVRSHPFHGEWNYTVRPARGPLPDLEVITTE